MTDEQIAYLEEFLEAYTECALWSSTDTASDDDENLEGLDVAPETHDAFAEDCEAFIASEWSDLQHLDAGQAGHDFWLTRNGHGAGFWDRGLGELGERLTKASKVYGSVDLYVGDDGEVHAS